MPTLPNLAKVVLAVGSLFLLPQCGQDAGEAGEDHTTSNGIVLKAVKAGPVTLEIPGQKLTLPEYAAFSMSTTEITQAQFEEVMGSNPAESRAEHLAVDRITLNEAKAFCDKLTKMEREKDAISDDMAFRLPTLGEWLLAAFPDGHVPESDALNKHAWYLENSNGLIHPVGAKTANSNGLHDMLGNVAEWTLPDPKLEKNQDLPAGYYSQTTIQVHPPRIKSGVIDSYDSSYDFNALKRQLALILSQENLKEVAESLNLKFAWNMSTDEVVTRLAKMTQARILRGTDLIEIGCSSADPVLARDVANGVAQSYRMRRITDERKIADTALHTLQRQLEPQEAKVEKARTKMNEIIKKYRIIDETVSESRFGDKAKIPTDKEIDDFENQIAALTANDGADLLKLSYRLGVETGTYDLIRENLRVTEVTRDSLLASGLYGVNHPQILSLETTITEKKKNLGIQANNIKGRLQQVLESAKQRSSDSASQQADDAIKSRIQMAEYQEARNEYNLAQAILQQMRTTYHSEMVDLVNPKPSVTIHEKATVPSSKTPASRSREARAVGGSVRDQSAGLLDFRFPSGREKERRSGVGFRIILAKE